MIREFDCARNEDRGKGRGPFSNARILDLFSTNNVNLVSPEIKIEASKQVLKSKNLRMELRKRKNKNF